MVLGELFAMLGARPTVRSAAAIGEAVAAEAAMCLAQQSAAAPRAGFAETGTSDVNSSGGGPDGGSGSNSGDGGRGGGDGDGSWYGFGAGDSFPRGGIATLLLAAAAALACLGSLSSGVLRQQQPQEAGQWLPAAYAPLPHPDYTGGVLLGAVAGGAIRVRRFPGSGSSRLGAWSSWLPHYQHPQHAPGSSYVAEREVALATRLLQGQGLWLHEEPHCGFWRDCRAGDSWGRQGTPLHGATARRHPGDASHGDATPEREQQAAVAGIARGAGVRLPTMGLPQRAATASEKVCSARSQVPRVEFGMEIARLGAARDGLHAARGQADGWLDQNAKHRHLHEV